ncbi:hypothetical protein NC652_000833 [Populus alba x Populus x berolinensis]|nr:hypothetical protein NC652_000833 [Populus alba x Populus x berolinensis]
MRLYSLSSPTIYICFFQFAITSQLLSVVPHQFACPSSICKPFSNGYKPTSHINVLTS